MNIKLLFLFLLLFAVNTSFAQSNNEKLNYTLISIAEKGNEDSLILILKMKPDINFRDANNGTALFYAVQNGHLNTAKILIHNGADVNIGLGKGISPLIVACINGDLDMADLLAYSGAKLESKDKYWATALHYSAALGYYYIVDMLLYYGANVNALTFENTNALLIASIYGDTAMANLLIKNDVDINKVNKEGYSPISVAIQNNDTIMFELLLAHKADVEVITNGRYRIPNWALLNKNSYAYKKLRPEESSIKNTKNNKYNDLNIAYRNNDKELIKQLKIEGSSSGIMPFYTSVIVNTSASLNKDDVFYNFGIGLEDSKYKTDLILNYGTRFQRKSVIISESGNSFTQLWETRRYFELYLQKRFPIVWKVIPFEIYGGLAGQFISGSYEGTKKKIEPNFVLAPKIGVQYNIDDVYIGLGYQYSNYQLYNISPHKIEIRLGFHIRFVAKPEQYQLLWL